jgi:hypothetical protein
MQFSKIISAGQTGVHRAALDFITELGLFCGGWCPKGLRLQFPKNGFIERIQ